jgi:excisionase family DNA binding protein
LQADPLSQATDRLFDALDRMTVALGQLTALTRLTLANQQPPPQQQLPDDEVEQIAFPIEVAAKISGLGRTTLFALVKSGELKSIRVGRRRLVTREALQDLLTRFEK